MHALLLTLLPPLAGGQADGGSLPEASGDVDSGARDDLLMVQSSIGF